MKTKTLIFLIENNSQTKFCIFFFNFATPNNCYIFEKFNKMDVVGVSCSIVFLFDSQQTALLEGLGPIPLPQARAASPIRTTSGILLSNMYPSHSGNLSFPWSGKYFKRHKDTCRI